MKLTQIYQGDSLVLCAETPKGWVNIPEEAAHRGVNAPYTMLELIKAGSDGLELVRNLVFEATCFAHGVSAPVITGCEKVLCIGLNYRQHAKECNLSIPPAPVLFNKFDSSLAADHEVIYLDPSYLEYDYEAELVAIIGKKAKNVTESTALDYVFGYTCGNDLSTRDLQFVRSNQWVLSKSMDGFGPVGPCVVTTDEIDPQNLRISSSVNGEVRQDSNTSDMIFTVAQIIADLSKHMTLMPGDIIFTGTPQGVMHGYPADQKNWLKPGDEVTVTIENIGTLHNSFC